MSASVTREDAEAVLQAIVKQFHAEAYDDLGPKLLMEWDWPTGGPTPTIVWEEGPYEWTMLAVHGGVDQEYGGTVPAVEIPATVFVEPYSGWALCLYPAS